MIKKIPVAELRVGMFVHDVNCSWRIEPNFVLRYKITEDRQVEEIHELGVREVYINTLLGDDLPGAPDETQVRRKLKEELQLLSPRGGEVPVHHHLASRAELLKAWDVHRSASDLIRGLMSDVRLGRQIEHDTVTRPCSASSRRCWPISARWSSLASSRPPTITPSSTASVCRPCSLPSPRR